MKKSLIINLLLASTLTACGGNPQPGNTPVIVTQSPLMLTVIPTNPPDCADSASFVADVTIPDNTPFLPKEIFQKIWRLKNTGTCAWNSNYSLVFANGEQMGAPASTPLSYTAPGEMLDLSIELTSPAENGTFVGNFELHAPDGKTVLVDYGQYIWVDIVVGDVAAIGSPPAMPGEPSEIPTPYGATCAYTPNPDFVNQTLALINSQRAAHDLPALTLNAQLTTAAQAHAIDMACNSFLSHVGSDGFDVRERVIAAGYTPSLVLETIYAQAPKNGGTPASAVQWWMSDLIHRNILLHKKVIEIGVGYAFFPESQWSGYWSVVIAASEATP